MSFAQFNIVGTTTHSTTGTSQPAYHSGDRAVYYADNQRDQFFDIPYNPGNPSQQALTPVRIGSVSDYDIGVTDIQAMIFHNSNINAAAGSWEILSMNETTGAGLELSTIENDLRHPPLRFASGSNHLVLFTATNIQDQHEAHVLNLATGVGTSITQLSSVQGQLFAHTQGRFWTFSTDFASLVWISINSNGTLNDSGTIPITFDFNTTDYAWHGLCPLGDDLLIIGTETANNNLALGRFTAITEGNTRELPANYRDYSTWVGAATDGGNTIFFTIPSVLLNSTRAFDTSGLALEFNTNSRLLSLRTEGESFVELYPLIYSE